MKICNYLDLRQWQSSCLLRDAMAFVAHRYHRVRDDLAALAPPRD